MDAPVCCLALALGVRLLGISVLLLALQMPAQVLRLLGINGLLLALVPLALSFRLLGISGLLLALVPLALSFRLLGSCILVFALLLLARNCAGHPVACSGIQLLAAPALLSRMPGIDSSRMF
jgi:hypothetical protein